MEMRKKIFGICAMIGLMVSPIILPVEVASEQARTTVKGNLILGYPLIAKAGEPTSINIEYKGKLTNPEFAL